MAFQYRTTEYDSLPQSQTEGYRAPHPTGTVIAIGGHAEAHTLGSVVRTVLDGGSVHVATLANGDPQESYKYNNEIMAGLGANTSHIVNQQDLLNALGHVDSRSAIYFGGGNQQVLMEAVGKYGRDQLKQAHQRGVTIAGSSAGAMVLGDLGVILEREPQIIEGLGVIPGVIIDTHYSERERRRARLRRVNQLRGLLGIGIDERTAIIARHIGPARKDIELEVIGEGGVHIVDRNVEIDLAKGDRFHIGRTQVLQRAH